MHQVELRLPDVGEGIDSAELLKWHVSIGTSVSEDDPLADVESDKAVVTVPSSATGVVSELRFDEGDRVRIGEVVAVILVGAGTSDAPAESPRRDSAPDPAKQQLPPSPASGGSAPPPLASPALRRLARERGVDLSSIDGSGPGGRIQREDLDRAIGQASLTAAAASLPAELARSPRTTETIPLRGLRREIARRLADAWQTVPMVIDYREVDAAALVDLRRMLRTSARQTDDRLASALTFTPLIVKAVSLALIEHRSLNASIDMVNEQIDLHGSIHIGIALASPEGLLVPVVRDADRKSLRELALEIARLADAGRARSLTPDQLRGATFTVNNYGGLGGWLGTPMIIPPQVANLGVGRIEERAVVRDGNVIARPIMPLALGGDHRLLDGDTMANFTNRLSELLEQPALMLMDAR